MTVTFGDPNYETEEVLKVRDITKVMTDEKYYTMYRSTFVTASVSRCLAQTAPERPLC